MLLDALFQHAAIISEAGHVSGVTRRLRAGDLRRGPQARPVKWRDPRRAVSGQDRLRPSSMKAPGIHYPLVKLPG